MVFREVFYTVPVRSDERWVLLDFSLYLAMHAHGIISYNFFILFATKLYTCSIEELTVHPSSIIRISIISTIRLGTGTNARLMSKEQLTFFVDSNITCKMYVSDSNC